MSSKIFIQVIICLKGFQSLLSELPEKTNDKGPTAQVWEDALARFRIWSSNIGAHQKGQSSLDHRLRDASHIRDQILKVLATLRQNLLDAEEIIIEAAHGEGDENSASELVEAYSGVQKLLECLFQLSMRIRRPAQRDKVLGRRNEDAKDFEDFDRRHVRDKFPGAPDVLVARLTTAISKRRSNLKYFERHHKKLGRGIKVPGNDAGDESATFYSSTLATTFREPSLAEIDKASISHASETSYAPSLFSGDSHVTIPPAPPESVDGKPFECPYCYIIVTISNSRDWVKHVFQDLEPYVCVFEDCDLPERLYKSHREWTAHFRDSHTHSLSSSRCPLCAEDGLTTSRLLQQHVRRHLEDLALFILPRPDSPDQSQDLEEADSDSSSQDTEDAERWWSGDDHPGQISSKSWCKHCNEVLDFGDEHADSCPNRRHEIEINNMAEEKKIAIRMQQAQDAQMLQSRQHEPETEARNAVQQQPPRPYLTKRRPPPPPLPGPRRAIGDAARRRPPRVPVRIETASPQIPTLREGTNSITTPFSNEILQYRKKLGALPEQYPPKVDMPPGIILGPGPGRGFSRLARLGNWTFTSKQKSTSPYTSPGRSDDYDQDEIYASEPIRGIALCSKAELPGEMRPTEHRNSSLIHAAELEGYHPPMKLNEEPFDNTLPFQPIMGRYPVLEVGHSHSYEVPGDSSDYIVS